MGHLTKYSPAKIARVAKNIYLRSRKTVRFSRKIMYSDKNQSIFSRQLGATYYLSRSGQTHEFTILYLSPFIVVKSKLTLTSFSSPVLLLKVNFVITLSK